MLKLSLLILCFLSSPTFSADEEIVLKKAAKTVTETTSQVKKYLLPPAGNNCPTGPKVFQGKVIEIESSQIKPNRNQGQAPVKVHNLKKPYPLFSTMDQAAKFFINYLRAEFKNHHVEYCADIKKVGNSFSFSEVIEGTPDSCPRPKERELSNIVAGVHTHPGSHDPQHTHNLDNSINIPSVNDYAVASYEKKPQFLGAPSGHILKFTSEDTQCRGKAFLKRSYKMIQEPFKKTRGKIKNQNNWTYIKSEYELNAMKRWICPKS